MVGVFAYIIHDDRCKRCGRCAEVCESDAISIPRGHAVTTSYGTVRIDQEKCTMCGKCRSVCKIRAISRKVSPRL